MPGTTKITSSFYELTGHELRTTTLIRLFNILLDEDRLTYFLNIFKSLRVNQNIMTNIALFDTYEVEGEREAWWDNISYDIYGTPYLWWVIALFNDVTNPFEELVEGTNLKVLKPEYLYTLFKDMDNISEL